MRRAVKLEMKLVAYYRPHTLQVDLNGSRVASTPITTVIQTVRYDATLSPGRNLIQISSQENGVRPSKVTPPSADTRFRTFAVLELSVK